MINTQTKRGGLKASVQSLLPSTGPSGSCLVGPCSGKQSVSGKEGSSAGVGMQGRRYQATELAGVLGQVSLALGTPDRSWEPT